MPHRFFDPVPGDTPRKPSVARSFIFNEPGSKNVWKGGEITEIDDTKFVIDIPSHAIKTWPGTHVAVPILVFYVRVNETDRTLWVPKDKLYTEEGQPLLGTRYRALRAAMEAVGQPEELPTIGGSLWMRWVDEDTTGLGQHPRKMWEMKYKLPGWVTEEVDTEYPCPECGDDGPHSVIDSSALECRKCYTSIDITDKGYPN